VTKAPAPLPRNLTSSRELERRTKNARSNSSGRSRTATPNLEAGDSRRLKPPKRTAVSRKASPNIHERQTKFDEDTLSSGDDESVSKRRRIEVATTSVDPNRRLRSRKAFSSEDGGKFTMIHAADTTAVPRKTSNASATIEEIIVKLRYPSASQRER
jgi:H3 lysine-79-specific histone-lysine N-methyltransferase